MEGVYGVTSLSPQRAPPARLLALVRGQWQIEHTAHGVRDVTFDADRSQVRCGNIPQVMAALRNTALGLLRSSRMAKRTSTTTVIPGSVPCSIRDNVTS